MTPIRRVAELEQALREVMRVTDPGDIRVRGTLAYWESRIHPARRIAREALGLPLGGRVKVNGKWVDAVEPDQ